MPNDIAPRRVTRQSQSKTDYMVTFKETCDGIATAVVAVVGVAFVVGFISWFAANGFPGAALQWASPFVFGLFVGFIAIPFAGISLTVIGIPLFRFWRHRESQSALSYLLAGILMSMVLALLLALEQRIVGALTDYFELGIALATIFIAGPAASLVVRNVSKVQTAFARGRR